MTLEREADASRFTGCRPSSARATNQEDTVIKRHPFLA